jgi:tubulin polyglutamylase TTLL9
VAIAKSATDYDPERGLKWSLDKLRRYLTAKHGVEAVSTLIENIGQIIVYSLRSVQSIIVQVWLILDYTNRPILGQSLL